MISFTSADLLKQPYCFEVGKEICLHSQDSGMTDVSRLGKGLPTIHQGTTKATALRVIEMFRQLLGNDCALLSSCQ
jgi:hypothetical protein